MKKKFKDKENQLYQYYDKSIRNQLKSYFRVKFSLQEVQKVKKVKQINHERDENISKYTCTLDENEIEFKMLHEFEDRSNVFVTLINKSEDLNKEVL